MDVFIPPFEMPFHYCRPEQCGMTKTDAAAQTLSGINPDVRLESYTMNITTVDGFERFKVRAGPNNS